MENIGTSTAPWFVWRTGSANPFDGIEVGWDSTPALGDLDNDGDLEFLFAEYEPRCYLFVVFECVRRLMLTGLLIFVYPGSHTQITIGLLLAFLSYSVMMDFSPYVEDVDDRLADVGQSQIVFVFIASLVLHAKDMPEQEGAPGSLFKGPLFAAVMVVIGTMTLLMTIYMLVAEYCGIGSPKDAQAAASSVSGGRPSRNRERATANLAKLRGAARATAAFARAGGESSGADDELESPGARMYRRQYRRSVAAAEDLSHIMSISQLKRVAPERRVDVSGCLDKADIEALDVPEPRTRSPSRERSPGRPRRVVRRGQQRDRTSNVQAMVERALRRAEGRRGELGSTLS